MLCLKPAEDVDVKYIQPTIVKENERPELHYGGLYYTRKTFTGPLQRRTGEGDTVYCKVDPQCYLVLHVAMQQESY